MLTIVVGDDNITLARRETARREDLKKLNSKTKSAKKIWDCIFKKIRMCAIGSKQRELSQTKEKAKDKTFIGEFDPGSGRTLAACLTHASRTVQHLTLNVLKAIQERAGDSEDANEESINANKKANTKERKNIEC